jgi:hypothetical protein
MSALRCLPTFRQQPIITHAQPSRTDHDHTAVINLTLFPEQNQHQSTQHSHANPLDARASDGKSQRAAGRAGDLGQLFTINNEGHNN